MKNNTWKKYMGITAITAVLLVGSVSAYFTDQDEKTNTFTVGKVTIDLEEPEWEIVLWSEPACFPAWYAAVPAPRAATERPNLCCKRCIWACMSIRGLRMIWFPMLWESPLCKENIPIKSPSLK